jgi:hypothetical protein
MDAWEFRDSSRYLLDTGFLMDATSPDRAEQSGDSQSDESGHYEPQEQHSATSDTGATEDVQHSVTSNHNPPREQEMVAPENVQHSETM